MRKPKKIVQWRFAFLVILLVLVNSRFIGIESASLSPDEATQWYASLQPLSEHLLNFSFATSETSTLFTTLLHIWSSIFGTKESALRALPALFSILALFPFFGIARILFNKRIAYGAWALYAFSPLGTALAQELCATSLFMFFTLVSTWSLLVAMRRSALIYRLLYVLAFSCALFSNPAAWYLLGFHLIFIVGAYFHHDSGYLGFRQWLGMMFAIALVIAGTFPLTLPPVTSSFTHGIASPLLAYAKLYFHMCGSAILIVPAAIIVFHLLFRSREYFRRFRILPGRVHFTIIWLIAMTVPPYIFAFAENDLGRADGGCAGLFPFLLLISTGIDTIAKNTHRHTLFVSIFLLSAIAVHLNTQHNAIPWKQVIGNKKSGGIIAVGSNFSGTICYYGSPVALNRSLVVPDSALAFMATQNQIREFCETQRRITLISSFDESTVLLRRFLEDQYKLQSDHAYTKPRWRTSTEPVLRVQIYSR